MERALAPSKDVVRVEAAAFGAEAGMIGAALMARDGTGIARAGFPDPSGSSTASGSSSGPAGPTGSSSGPAAGPTGSSPTSGSPGRAG